MGRKTDKQRGVTFKLVWEGEDGNNEGRRVFQVVDNKSTKNQVEKEKILNQFTKEDLGLVQPKKKELQEEQPTQEEVIHSHVKGREDLWITHLMRMKQQQQQADQDDDDEGEEESDEESKQVQKDKKIIIKGKNALASHIKKAHKTMKENEDDEWATDDDEDEEWATDDDEEEGDDDDDVEYEIEEREEDEGDEEYHFDDEDDDKVPDLVPMDAKIQQIKFPEEKKEEQIMSEKPKELDPDADIDLKKMVLSEGVKTQRFDEYGLPLGTKYNYMQHIAEHGSGGAPTMSFVASYDKAPELAKDVDIPVDRMNDQEREVFEALEFQGDDDAYEQLEDDFMTMANDGKVGAFEKKQEPKKEQKAPAKKQKKVEIGEEKIIEISTSKEESKPKKAKKVAEVSSKPQDSIMQNASFNKVLEDTVKYLREKHKDERQKNRIKYGDSDSEGDENDEEEHFADKRFDRSAKDNLPVDPSKYIEKVPFNKDFAAQQALAEEEESEEEERDFEDIYVNPSEVGTRHTEQVSCYTGPTTQKSRLNIVKEKKPEGKKSRKAKAKGKENGEDEEERNSQEDGDDDEENSQEEGEESGMRQEETFNRRKKGESKEEKKARKALAKQFKQERKEKKKKFKDEVDSKLKFQKSVLHKQQQANLQGFSVYKYD